jgi:hypothetical protein
MVMFQRMELFQGRLSGCCMTARRGRLSTGRGAAAPLRDGILDRLPIDRLVGGSMERDQHIDEDAIPDPGMGAFPSPEVLRQWEEVTPGSAERILRLVEEEAHYRRRLEVS